MPMSVSDIAAGKCYATKGKEFYTVVSINGGVVTYQSWKNGDAKLSLRTNTAIKAFAQAVTKEIPCAGRP